MTNGAQLNGWSVLGGRLTANLGRAVVSVQLENGAQYEVSMDHLSGMVENGTAPGEMVDGEAPDEPGLMLTVKMTLDGASMLAARMGPDGGFPDGTTIEELALSARPEAVAQKGMEVTWNSGRKGKDEQ